MPTGIYIRTDEQKKKMSLAAIGNQRALGSKHSEEWKQKASDRMMGNKYRIGIKLSNEERATLLSYAIGNKVNLGRRASEETRQKLSNAHKGENSWQWKLGLRSKPYGINWTATLKRLIRERDNYACRLCGIPQNGRLLDVHHIDFNKNNNDEENLISLCADCHRKTLHTKNRLYWIELLESIKQGSTLRIRKVQ